MASWASCGPLDPAQRVPVELVHGLEVGEARAAKQAGHGAVAADQHLGFKQLQQELLVVPAVVRRLADQLGVLAMHGRQLELATVCLEHGLSRCVAHDAPRSSRRS